MSAKYMDHLMDEIFEDKKVKSKVPFWVHLVGKLSLQGFFGWLTLVLWSNFHYFWGFCSGFIFTYLLTLLLFGHIIRRKIRELMT